MPYTTLSLVEDGPVHWLTLNRPEALNALSRAMVDELRTYFGSLPSRQDVRVVVLRGAGRAFCAGLDLKEGPSGDGASTVQGTLRAQRHISELVMMMRRAPQVFVACVHGAACGGGFALALAADIRIAGESARMNAAFIRIGLSACDVGVSYFLPRLVGVSVASELLLTGRFIHAARALATGLVSEVTPDDGMEEAARRLVADLLATSPVGLRLTKECLNASVDASSLDQVIAMEDRNQVLCTQTQDFREGVVAFLQKRPPSYREN